MSPLIPAVWTSTTRRLGTSGSLLRRNSVRRTEHFGSKSYRAKQVAERFSHRDVVIDHEDDRLIPARNGRQRQGWDITVQSPPLRIAGEMARRAPGQASAGLAGINNPHQASASLKRRLKSTVIVANQDQTKQKRQSQIVFDHYVRWVGFKRSLS